MSLKCFLKSKIHHARVTSSNLNYIGSIFVDGELLKKANIFPNEKVEVINITNGKRWSTYAGVTSPGVISVNGGGARLCQEGDILIILAYEYCEKQIEMPKMILVGKNNKFIEYLTDFSNV